MSVMAGPCACSSFADRLTELCGCMWFVGRNMVTYLLPSVLIDVIDDGNVAGDPFATFRNGAKVALAEVGSILVGLLASPPKINAKIIDFKEMGQQGSSREAG